MSSCNLLVVGALLIFRLLQRVHKIRFLFRQLF